MLTQKDLERKSFKSNELTKITPPVFDRNFKVTYPEDFEKILHLLKQIQLRKAARSNQVTVELERMNDGSENEHTVALKTELMALEHHRRTIHTIYTQIVSHLYLSNRTTPLYLQSPENNPELRNLVVVKFGEYRHRVQISKKHIVDTDIEFRGEYIKPEPSSLVCLSDEEFAEFGYSEIDVIRICRRISNHILSVRRKFDKRICAIHNHNYVVSQINKLISQGLVTLEKKDEKPSPSNPPSIQSSQDAIEKKLVQDEPKQAKSQEKNSKTHRGEPSKKPLNVIRKRTFVLHK